MPMRLRHGEREHGDSCAHRDDRKLSERHGFHGDAQKKLEAIIQSRSIREPRVSTPTPPLRKCEMDGPCKSPRGNVEVCVRDRDDRAGVSGLMLRTAQVDTEVREAEAA